MGVLCSEVLAWHGCAISDLIKSTPVTKQVMKHGVIIETDGLSIIIVVLLDYNFHRLQVTFFLQFQSSQEVPVDPESEEREASGFCLGQFTMWALQRVVL